MKHNKNTSHSKNFIVKFNRIDKKPQFHQLSTFSTKTSKASQNFFRRPSITATSHRRPSAPAPHRSIFHVEKTENVRLCLNEKRDTRLVTIDRAKRRKWKVEESRAREHRNVKKHEKKEQERFICERAYINTLLWPSQIFRRNFRSGRFQVRPSFERCLESLREDLSNALLGCVSLENLIVIYIMSIAEKEFWCYDWEWTEFCFPNS